MSEPSPDALRRSLLRHLDSGTGSVRVRGVDDISPGLGYSKVYRVILDDGENAVRPMDSVILKVPDWGGDSAVQPDDPLVLDRERLFFQEGMADRLPSGLCVPSVLGIDRHRSQTWIWMHDVGPWLAVRWEPEQALAAVRHAALLHRFYRTDRAGLDRLPWLGREQYRAYAHHIATAHANLDEVARVPLGRQLFGPGDVGELHAALNLFDRAVDEMRSLPLTLVHGDFHIRNLGFDPAGSLVVIDWAHVGLAPLGCDLATFQSVYRLFGGHDDGTAAFDDDLLAEYVSAVDRVEPRHPGRAGIELAAGLWHLTWGLHLRLGPGLTALLRGYLADPTERERAAADIQEGCVRALAFVRRRAG